MVQAEQLSLFSAPGGRAAASPTAALPAALTAEASLASAMGAFHDHMRRKGFTEHTVKAFLSDLRLLARYVGLATPIGRLHHARLNEFLTWLVHGRDVPCSPKSYARRVTTLKVFFGWLAAQGALHADPASAVVHQRVITPLPDILYDDQVERLLATTRALLDDAARPDARPHLLVTLLLATGIKKGECLAIDLGDLDLNAQPPTLYVRYDNPRMRKKERKLALPSDLPALIARYRHQYGPRERLFECTARNLEYVLRDAAERASVAGRVSFESLRMTAAVQDFRRGMDADRLREKLGLSPVTWTDTFHKIQRLAAPPL